MDQNNSDIKPTSLRISTMTATCKINSNINLEEAAKMFIEIIKEKKDIKYIEHGKTTAGISNKNISEKKAAKKKVFYNQMTVLVNLYEGKSNNIKLFNNGAISMTGLKSVEDGEKAVEIVLKYMKTNDLILENKDATVNDFKIVLINSDYYIGYEIKRSELHQLLINKYQIFSSYEPCIYPGVNSKYYWNQDYTDSSKYKRGVCYCTNPCNGKGEGSGNGNCKKVTIAIFQSGKLIITGAKTYVQINDAYDFINNVFRDHYQSVKREIPAFLLKEQQEKDAREAKVKEEKEKNREAKKIVKKQNTYPEKLTPPKGATIRWIKVEK